MSLEYRRLEPGQVALLGSIDRSEHIEGVYRLRGGVLELERASSQVAGWEPRELDAYVKRLTALLAGGGVALGAWHGDALVGLASLGAVPVGGDPARLKLDMLYVDAGFRGRGIARELSSRLAAEARARGARSLYISATPTRSTVDAYLRLGARLLEEPDPELLSLEPEDIHLALDLP